MSFEGLNSPFTHLLGTNYVPNKTEIHRINNFLSLILSEVSQLDTEIDRLWASL
jgi:hypothetical protein